MSDVITKNDLKEIADELMTKHSEVKAKREKNFKLDASEENAYKLSETNKRSETVTFMKSLTSDRMEAKKISDVRAKFLNEGTGSAGGFLVPEEMEREIFTKIDDYGQIRRDARVIPMRTNALKLNSLATDITVTKIGEGVAKPESEPVFAQGTLDIQKYAAITTWSDELADDADAAVLDYIISRFAEVLAKAQQDDYVNDATAGSEGLLVDAGTTVQTQGAATITFDDLLTIKTNLQGLSISEDTNAKYYMHPTVWAEVVKSETASGSINKINLATGLSAWGRDVVLVNEMPDFASLGAAQNYVVYADLSRHLIIGERHGMRVSVSNEGTVGANSLWEQDLTGLRVVARQGHKVVLPACVQVLATL